MYTFCAKSLHLIHLLFIRHELFAKLGEAETASGRCQAVYHLVLTASWPLVAVGVVKLMWRAVQGR